MNTESNNNMVKLFAGFIFSNQDIFIKTKKILVKKFGAADFESQLLAFNYTKYYEKEFGCGLKRKFLSFRKLVPAQKLAGIKLFSNTIEKRLSKNNRRLINIDPGILCLGKVCLATTKNHCHRIHLNKGIYAEVTLYYEHKSFRPWNWTYADYRTKEYIQIFNKIRQIHSRQLKNH